MDRPGCLAARMEFMRRYQMEDETFDKFAEELERLSLDCDYGSYRGIMLRDVFACNLHPKYADIQLKLIAAHSDSSMTLTLGGALLLAKSTDFTLKKINPKYEPIPAPPRQPPRQSPRSSVQNRLDKFKKNGQPSASGSSSSSPSPVQTPRNIPETQTGGQRPNFLQMCRPGWKD